MGLRTALAAWPHRRKLALFVGLPVVLVVVWLLWYWAAQRTPILVAVALPLTGPQAHQGQQAARAIALSFQAVNHAGGIDGHPLHAVLFDDEGKPAVAEKRAREIVAGRAVAVLGHLSNDTSASAGPVYRSGQVPVVTGTANADSLTHDNPYSFQAVFNASAEGRNLAVYAARILNLKTAGIIASDDPYGKAVTAAFEQAFQHMDQGGKVLQRWTYYPDAERSQKALDEIVRGLQANPAPAFVLLLVTPNTLARDVIVQLRKRGREPRYLGGTNLGASAFAELFKDYDQEEKRQPGYYTDRIHAAAPLVFDSAGLRAQEFVREYQQAHRDPPDAGAAKFYDAAQLVAAALRKAGADCRRALAARDWAGARRLVRDRLAECDESAKAVPGLSGPLYFDKQQSHAQPVRIGQFLKGRFISAPYQITLMSNAALIDLDREQAKNRLLQVGSDTALKQRVVYTGIDVNQVIQFDPNKGSFTADFYLWFRYAGDDDDVTEVEFPSSVERRFDPKATLVAKGAEMSEDGLKYRLYRVRDQFKTSFDFTDFPFDRQLLSLRLQNTRLARDQVVYAVDTFGLRLPRPEGAAGEAFQELGQWRYLGTDYTQDTQVTRSTRGDPLAFYGDAETEFSGFHAVAVLQRRTVNLLVKMLLPLALLVLLVYVTLHFTESLDKERMSVAITGLLVSAVILGGIQSQLSDANYTTAIEYGFYVFFLLCLLCILAALALIRLRAAGWTVAAGRLEVIARVVYASVVVATVLIYAILYRDRG
jgi:branched-chain amino acid transport system substrate-binding protein